MKSPLLLLLLAGTMGAQTPQTITMSGTASTVKAVSICAKYGDKGCVDVVCGGRIDDCPGISSSGDVGKNARGDTSGGSPASHSPDSAPKPVAGAAHVWQESDGTIVTDEPITITAISDFTVWDTKGKIVDCHYDGTTVSGCALVPGRTWDEAMQAILTSTKEESKARADELSAIYAALTHPVKPTKKPTPPAGAKK